MKNKSVFIHTFMICLLMLFFSPVEGQHGDEEHASKENHFCLFDQMLEAQKKSGMGAILMENEMKLQRALQKAKESKDPGEVFTVPVVFHVMHLGEQQGTGSNIPESQVLQALDDLNDHFRDVQNTGFDVEIEFCLAQRDPDGNNSTGINRVDGTAVPSYLAGININGGNAPDVKGLSIWPEGECVNIWIVHNIISGSLGTVLGYATFPGAPATIDGIVMRASATGTNDFSKVITHEMGHFFNLYHTFQGSGGFTQCPDNTSCADDGDMVCDTRPHSFMNQTGNWFPCDESQYLNCDSGSYGNDVTENHMNYTGNSCRDEFTPEQSTRMRQALQTLRPDLLDNLCCVPACTSVTASFTSSETNVEIGDDVVFTNTSMGATDYEWSVEGNTFTSTNLTYTFDNFGTFDVCLMATDGDCINQYCETIEVSCIGSPDCEQEVDCLNLVANGDFSVHCVGENSSDLANGVVCNWRVKHNTPRFCTDINGADAMVLAEWDEAIVTENPVPQMEVGKQYKLSFEYLRVGNTPINEANQLHFGFDHNPTTNENFPYSDHLLIGTLEDLPIDAIGNYSTCQDPLLFNYFEVKFTYEEGPAPHLFFHYTPLVGGGNNTYMHVQNVAIMCCDVDPTCTPIPDFTVEVDCPSTFTGTNAGDGNDYVWTFCDGSTQTGPVVTADLPPGDCEVCLTIFCAFGVSATICKEVTIEECPDDCLSVEILELYCDNQGTTDPNDDFWYFDMIVTDNSGDGVYWSTSGDIDENGSYAPDIKTIYPGGTIMNNMSITFTVFDAENEDCSVEVTVDAPPKCSDPCRLDVKTDIYCKEIEGSNYYFVELSVDVLDDECFMIVRKNDDGDDEVLYTGSGPEDGIVLGPFNPADEFVMWVKLCDYFDCVLDIWITAPEKCDNCIDYMISNVTCYDNGTSDPDDDYWTFDIYVEGPNDYWIAGDPIDEAGSYENVKTIWVSTFEDVCFKLYDNKEECSVEVCIEAPEKCSKDCKFEVKYEISDCKWIEGEAVFYIELEITSESIECFTIKKKNLDGSDEVLGDYPANTNIVLGPFDADEDFTLWIMGCEIFDCVRDMYISAPECEEGENIIEGADTRAELGVSLYPNPVVDKLFISSNTLIKSYNFYNSTGNLIESNTVNESNLSLDIETLHSGLYFIEVINLNDEKVIKKFYKID